MIYALLRGVMRVTTHTYLVGLFRVRGLENVPRTGGLLVCPNHSGTLDPPMVPAFLPRSDSWSMAKSDYFARAGVTRSLFTGYHAFPVVRHSPDRKALRRGLDIVGSGAALIIYPEGTRVEDGRLRAPEPGAGFFAQQAEVPVLPVGVVGTNECLPKGARLPRRVPVQLTFGKPFRVARKRSDGTRISHQEAADAIMLAIAELIPEHMRGAFTDLEARRRTLGEVYQPYLP